MKTDQIFYKFNPGEKPVFDKEFSFVPDLILAFGCPKAIQESLITMGLRSRYPDAIITGCSTAGEINGTKVTDNSVVLSAISFASTKLLFHSVALGEGIGSFEAGAGLVKKFEPDGLKHIFILSDGLSVNGTELVTGIRSVLPKGVNVTGGLAGDGADFKQTWVVQNNGLASMNIITAIGFYGDAIQIGYGSMGGWDSFGIERRVTRSVKNVLYEIDNLPALALYKSFLGEKASELPASGLLFPLSIRSEHNNEPLVRTILAIDEAAQSLTFAGDIPEGAFVKLMKANVNRLIEGAAGAAEISIKPLKGEEPSFAILISCVGRKLVLKQLVEEEVEAVSELLGGKTLITGFYSYGELAPFLQDARCELHNQTMTITAFSEVLN
jgi:hypothetical protein